MWYESWNINFFCVLFLIELQSTCSCWRPFPGLSGCINTSSIQAALWCWCQNHKDVSKPLSLQRVQRTTTTLTLGNPWSMHPVCTSKQCPATYGRANSRQCLIHLLNIHTLFCSIICSEIFPHLEAEKKIVKIFHYYSII